MVKVQTIFIPFRQTLTSDRLLPQTNSYLRQTLTSLNVYNFPKMVKVTQQNVYNFPKMVKVTQQNVLFTVDIIQFTVDFIKVNITTQKG